MDYRFKNAMNSTDFLSLAKNISKSKLVNKPLLRNISSQLKPDHNGQPEQTSTNSKLLYSNIVQNKERSRSVNAMMSLLLKPKEILPSSQKVQQNQNIKAVDLNTSIGTNISSLDELTTNPLNVSSLTQIPNQHPLSNNNSEADRLSIYSEIPDNNIQRLSLNSLPDNKTNPYYGVLKKYPSQIVTNFLRATESKVNDCQNESIKSYDIYGKNHYVLIPNGTQGNSYKWPYQNITPTKKLPHGINFFRTQATNNNINKNNDQRYMGNFPMGQQNENNTLNEIAFNKQNESKIKTSIVTFIQLEDLIVLEEKLYHIIDSFQYGKPVPKQCVEWWTFYIYSSICGKFELIFTNSFNLKQIAHEASTTELLCMILLYEALWDLKIPQLTLNNLKTMLSEVYQNFLIIVHIMLTRISAEPRKNIWLNKIQNIIISKRTRKINKSDHMKEIKKNNEYIQSIFKNILRTYPSKEKIDISSLNYYLKQLSKISIKSLNDYFRKKINIDFCKTGDSLTFVINDTPVMPNIPVPYLPQNLPKNRRKNFTLVIDLDETLISFRRDEIGRGVLHLRPGINNFLTELKPLYELILFTAGTQEYADPILDIIEKSERIFDKRLYRQHAVIIENVFVKDLSKLGRDLSKTIIIDNMPHNFRLQKENGIFIKNFEGYDVKDTALFDLIPILKMIASDEENDVRVELKRLEREIFTKITTNLKNEEN